MEVLESILTPSQKIGQLRWTFLNPYLVLLKKTLGQSRWNKLFPYITFQQFISPFFKVWWLFYKISFWTFMGLVAFIAFPLALFLAQNLFDKAFWPRSGHKKQNCLELLEAAIFLDKVSAHRKRYKNHHPSYDIIWCNMMAKPIIWWPPPIIWWPPPIIWWPPPIIWHHMMQYDGPCFWTQHFSYQKKPGFQNKMWQSMQREKKRPKWRKQETGNSLSFTSKISGPSRPKVKGNGKIQFTSFRFKTLEAQSEGTRKFHSRFFTSKFWRPKVKEPGIH